MCFVELCPLNKYFEVKTAENKNDGNISLLQRPVTFIYFWLNYCNENDHIERTPIAVNNIGLLFHLASKIINSFMKEAVII